MFKEDSSKPSRQKLCLMIIIIITWVTWVVDALCVWFAPGWCTKRTPAKTVIKEIIIIIIIIADQGLVLNKQKCRDSLRLRYNMPPSDLPSKCFCGEKYTVCHALSCKKGGFVVQRHGGVCNLLTSLIGKVCTKVEVEPQLQPLSNERFNLRRAVTSPQARLDFKAGGFWSCGVTAFFDVIVTYVNSKCNQGKTTTTIFKEQEEEKKQKYQQRVLDIEMGSFTPVVFGTKGGMGADCTAFSNA